MQFLLQQFKIRSRYTPYFHQLGNLRLHVREFLEPYRRSAATTRARNFRYRVAERYIKSRDNVAQSAVVRFQELLSDRVMSRRRIATFKSFEAPTL